MSNGYVRFHISRIALITSFVGHCVVVFLRRNADASQSEWLFVLQVVNMQGTQAADIDCAFRAVAALDRVVEAGYRG